MFSEKNVSTVVKVVMIMILTFFIVNSKPVETTSRLFVVMKSNKLEAAKVVPVSLARAPVPPSGPNRCTYALLRFSNFPYDEIFVNTSSTMMALNLTTISLCSDYDEFSRFTMSNHQFVGSKPEKSSVKRNL
ncbi:hypothetical protein CMV_010596 [Castanea mollissima]|uniref:Uncharacterized protein n=1 Tax=Castanea mollissima TaxID=60419 RepID=A0A8J4RIZ4_9ROSI|nr:hypothetical protein CMV_010596 [Castanea mollissima]